MSFQQTVRVACAITALALAGASACAQNYPVKQIRFVVGFPAGDATDVVARAISQPLAEALGQPVVVARLQGEISRIVKIPEVRDRFLALGAEPVGNSPEQFAAFYRNEVAKWGKVVKESGAQID